MTLDVLRKTLEDGRKVIFIHEPETEISGLQCKYCVYRYTLSPCPIDSDERLICENNHNSAWKLENDSLEKVDNELKDTVSEERIIEPLERTLSDGRKVIFIKDESLDQCSDCVYGDLSWRVDPCPSYGDDILFCATDKHSVWRPKERIKTTVEKILEQVKSTVEKDQNNQESEGKKYDHGKNRYDLIPAHALDETVKVLTAGAHKYNEAYDEENWRKVDYPNQRYFAALQRHIWAVKRGETHDPETGLHHYAHAISNLMFLLELQLEKEKQ